MSVPLFMQYVLDYYCSLHIDDDHLQALKEAVYDLVKDVTARVGEHDKRFKAAEFVPVGSFEEGTKIQTPNEFDFMIILHRLFDKSNTYIGDGCHKSYKMMFLQNKEVGFQNFCINLYADEWCLSPEYIRQDYTKRLDEVLKQIKTWHILTRRGVLVLEGNEFLTLKTRWRHFSKTFDPIKLEPTRKLVTTDVVNDSDIAYDITVEIDLMPSLGIEDRDQILGGLDFPSQFKDLVAKNGCHLVAKSCGEGAHPLCFQISFAASEVQLMKNLHQVHSNCYKVLKYLLTQGTNVNRPLKSICLSSYMLKNAFLFHEYDHKCTNPSLDGCMKEVLLYIRERFANGQFKSFFMRELNVWGRFYRIPMNDCWSPPGIDDRDVCIADWCFIFWFEMWRQIINRALEIFHQIADHIFTDEPLLYYLESGGVPAHVEQAVQTRTNITEYKENSMDVFLNSFKNLRENMKVITVEYLRHGSGPRTGIYPGDPPKRETYEKILPKFPDFLDNIEKLCGIKVDIPRSDPPVCNLAEVIYSRDG
ncbi:hypothetical protein FSP39_005771 [Pinctada imbricata]|uniref:Uncharacterized protein n=1 Tax=Pinctada imbricata TaxID=66713 RepID=A0AA88YHU7_PINIB|nr:hypothetical protein FSP39_005771 [Pinctada imbricata]